MKCFIRTFKMALALGVFAIGVCMLYQYELPKPPALSGMAFVFIGISLWIPYCPICKALCGAGSRKN